MNPIDIGQGIRLHVLPAEQFTTNTLCVLIRRPLSRTEATLNALLPPVLSRGSAGYPSRRALTLASEKMRGAIFESQIIKKGEQQILQSYFECVNDCPSLLKDGLHFLREVILNPLTEGDGFKGSFVRGEAALLQKQIEGRVNHKSDYAKLQCVALMCEDEPFGIYGDGYAEDLPDITPAGLLRHYKKIMAVSPVDIIAVGRWDTDRLAAELSGLFTCYREEVTDMGMPAVKPGRAKWRVKRLEVGSVQGNLCAGLRGAVTQTGDRYVQFQLANEILGGSANAKLFTQVRERDNLCYSIYSFVYRFKSLLCVQCGTEAAHFGYVMAAIEKALDEIQKGIITESEWENAKQSLTRRWRVLRDSPSGLVDFYMSQYLLGDRDTLDDLLARVEAAHCEDVAEAAGLLSIDTVVTVQ